MEYFYSLLIQLLYSVGIIVVFGLIMHIITRGIYKAAGSSARRLALATGFIGTPIHEGAHALMCLIFGHTIQDVKFFTLSSDKVLGYVKHSYNKRSFYQKIGNFFIGIAPVLLGGAVILILMWLLAPSTFSGITDSIGQFVTIPLNPFSAETYAGLGSLIIGIFSALFLSGGYASFCWWIFLLLAAMISMHMSLSPADVKGSLHGLIFVVAVFAIVDIVLYFTNTISYLNIAMAYTGSFLLSFFFISVLFALIVLLLTLIVKAILTLANRKQK